MTAFDCDEMFIALIYICQGWTTINKQTVVDHVANPQQNTRETRKIYPRSSNNGSRARALAREPNSCVGEPLWQWIMNRQVSIVLADLRRRI